MGAWAVDMAAEEEVVMQVAEESSQGQARGVRVGRAVKAVVVMVAAMEDRLEEEKAALAALGSDSRSQTATSRPHPREQSHHGNTSGPWATLSNTETSSSMRRIPVGSTQCLIGCHSGSTPLRADTAVVER